MTNKEKVILGLVAIVAIAGVALASSGVLPINNKNTTNAFVQNMLKAKQNVTSVHLDVAVNGSIEDGADGQGGQFALKGSGVVSKAGEHDSADIHITLSGAEAGSQDMAAEMDLRVLDRVLYLRPTRIPPLPFIEPSQIMNKWFSLDPIEMYKQFGNSDKAAELENTLNAGTRMPAEFYEKAYALTIDTGLVSKLNKKGSEVVSGVPAEKYEMTLNMQKLPDFLAKYADLYNSFAPTAGLEPMPVKNFTDDDKEALNALKISPISFWVGKDDYLVYKTSFSMSFDDSGATSVGQNSKGTVTFEITASDYNKEVTVEKPEKAMPIQQFFQSLMSQN